MLPLFTWLIAIPVLGAMTGLRTMTPIAILCLFAWRGHLPVHHSWAFWTTSGISALIFSVLAIGELIGDKLPKTPNRTAPIPLIGRMCFGGLVGAIAATALHGAPLEGVILGATSAVVGAFVGFSIRRFLVETHGWNPIATAIGEDVLAIVLSVFMMGAVTG